jgi:hypothetical protein
MKKERKTEKNGKKRDEALKMQRKKRGGIAS